MYRLSWLYLEEGGRGRGNAREEERRNVREDTVRREVNDGVRTLVVTEGERIMRIAGWNGREGE